MNDKTKLLAIISLVLGILGLGAWCLPICGGPLALAGIVLGILGVRGEGKIMAIIGLALNGLALIATIVNAAWGMKMAMDGDHPLIGPAPPGQHAPGPQPPAPTSPYPANPSR
jgi:hypothetical protein